MDTTPHDTTPDPVTQRLGLRLQALRRERDLTLEDMADQTGLSRATLSRIERGDTSPTAAQLNRLANALNRPMSRLLADVEDDPALFVARADQPVWVDPDSGYHRRMVSPPASGFLIEMVECEIPAGRTVAYDTPPVVGLEHHVTVLSGLLDLTLDGRTYSICPGDCLRYRLAGASRFHVPGNMPARYLIAIARP